ncbi:multiheme c-type cytochrome [Hyphomicrobium sp. 2TAF46]|uniref:multiheme c-type cytochrome n=1 Tax=Hyphomicrobium sp. 2TAF46 TaxID=3233019 RepID=UPI003F9152D4
MVQVSRVSLLACACVGATLVCVMFSRQNAIAGSEGVEQTQQSKSQQKLGKNAAAPGESDPANAKNIEIVRSKSDAHSGQDESLYPTAAQCGGCHKQIYEEWSSSQHAYASISPMFHKFEQKFQSLTQGTVGTFCVRCHQQVGTQLGEAREAPLWARSQISREGITCITCHRVKEEYGKVNGERRVEPGKIYEPVYGSGEKSVIKNVLANKETYSVKTGADGRGNDIHKGMITNDQITKSEFCVSCHQVAVNLGIKLEIVWDQYRDSPARKAGVTCQDCHMGKSPGQPAGYATAPSAIVGGKEINPGRKHANHRFIGPGYSIAHPGIFPHNTKAQATSIEDWLQFDWRAGWGSPKFEDKIAAGKINVKFPKRWADQSDREDAREIIDENLKKLDERDKLRRQVMENSSKVDGPYVEGTPRVGADLAFSYKIKNINTGHNLPSGSLGAQPQLWVNVAVVDPDGKNIWESGYVDSNGDMADLHSLDVAAGRIDTDQMLVNFQTKFLTTNVKGTDREMYLPVNFDIDPLPQLRPPSIPTTVLNHPPLVRMENHSLPPLGVREAKYSVPGKLIKKPGKYRLAFRMRSRAEPIYFMRFVGATKAMEESMNERIMNFHDFEVDVLVNG